MTRRKAIAVTALASGSVSAAQIEVKALVFDVFGTVVDWRSSIIRNGKALEKSKGIHIDWGEFADKWRAGYSPSMNRVRMGEMPWTKIDTLHRMILDKLIEEYKLDSLSEAEKQQLNLVWHRLDPWPDSVNGLKRLRKRYLLSTLSNGNTSLLAEMAKYAGLPWDVVLSADMAKHFKPDPEVYLMAADHLSVRPEELMMVAAHQDDLRAARKCGLKTAFVPRPLEHGPKGKKEGDPDPKFDFVAKDFLDLATKLGV